MEAIGRLRLTAVGTAAALAAFLAVGAVGVRNYGLNYWFYRGFSPPRDPAWVTQPGTQDRFSVASPALGGRSQAVYAYLPPDYWTSRRRYPVIYLLHGFPGRPLAFIETVRMGVVVDELATRNAARAAILVMPYGSTGTFTDKEWANGVGRGQGWATFVSRDLVRAVDARYRTIPSARGRAIAGLSEGGYGAINIALHNPGEFGVVESWSGYEHPDPIRSIFGRRLEALAANDPTLLLPSVARQLRRQHTFFWFYSGSDDHYRKENRSFALQLSQLRIPHHYFESFGGHNWGLWRKNAVDAYLAAIARVRHG
jgi:enterochelin esterase-like enzyme